MWTLVCVQAAPLPIRLFLVCLGKKQGMLQVIEFLACMKETQMKLLVNGISLAQPWLLQPSEGWTGIWKSRGKCFQNNYLILCDPLPRFQGRCARKVSRAINGWIQISSTFYEIIPAFLWELPQRGLAENSKVHGLLEGLLHFLCCHTLEVFSGPEGAV